MYNPENLDAAYTWDNEGRWTTVQYPGQPNAPVSFAYQYDVMGRPEELTETQCTAFDSNGYYTNWTTAPVVENAAYNASGQMASLEWATYPNLAETFTYNSLSQLTRETMPDSQMDMQYIYTAGQNNGRIAQSIDSVGGQTVNYTYDALNRLTAAAATGGQWGQAYAYDGFGNLKSKTVTAGSFGDRLRNPQILSDGFGDG